LSWPAASSTVALRDGLRVHLNGPIDAAEETLRQVTGFTLEVQARIQRARAAGPDASLSAEDQFIIDRVAEAQAAFHAQKDTLVARYWLTLREVCAVPRS
jgi:hypothetical protein